MKEHPVQHGEQNGGPTGRITCLPLHSVAIEDQRYRISKGGAADSLRESIGRWGCLTPPVCHQTDGSLVPVTGFRRLQVCRELLGPEGTVEVRVMDSSTPPVDLLSLAVWDTRRDGAVNPFLVCRTVRRALDLGLERELIKGRLLVDLGQEPEDSVMDRHLSLERICGPLAEALESRGVSLRRALRWVSVGDKAGELLAWLAESFRLNGRALQEWGGMLDQVARRDGMSWQQVAERAELVALATEQDRQLDQRAQAAFGRLWALRYPTWQAAKVEAEQRVKRLGLPERVEVSWDERFEEEGFTLSIAVRQPEQLQADLESLLEPERLDRIAKLLEAL
ncbi:MAG: hypothetical protein JW797_11275 [Bradymonadales bacterium]|nr:hypothetical protein [Bradymonadales bacterium]